MTAADTFSLSDLKSGMVAEIVDYAKDCAHRIRFEELGLIPGAKVQILRVAPLRDPIQVRVGNSLLSIRKQDAKAILVQVLATT